MIHWHTINIPVFIPTSGFVLCWLLIGLVTLLWIALTPRSAYRRIVPRESAFLGLLSTASIVALWPVVWVVRLRESIRRREAIAYRVVVEFPELLARKSGRP